ncbi:MAG: hypothetical protein V4451_04630 [Pseudomonadota bacterium]
MHALMQEVAQRALAKEEWQTISYFYPLLPWQWGLLKRWMMRRNFEFQTSDAECAVGWFQYRFVGFRK